MPKDKKFVNPLTQPSTSPSTDTATLPATSPSTFTPTAAPVPRRKRGAQAFEKTHERITLWLDKGLKARFEQLAEEQEVSKAALLDEAIADLLSKYHV